MFFHLDTTVFLPDFLNWAWYGYFLSVVYNEANILSSVAGNQENVQVSFCMLWLPSCNILIRLFKKEELKHINKSYSASLFSGFVQVVILYESLAFDLNLFSECLDHSHFVRALRSLSVLGDLG